MKFKQLLGLVAAVMTAIPSGAFAQSTQNSTQNNPVINVIQNPGFESGINARHVKSGGTSALVQLHGNAVSWQPTVAGQTYTTNQYAVPQGLAGSLCLAKIWYRTSEVAFPYNIRVIDGSANQLQSAPLAQSVTTSDGMIGFQCPSSGTIALQVQANTGTVPTNPIVWDDEHLGSNYKLSGFIDAVPFNVQSFNTVGTFTYNKTPGTRYVEFEVVAGGGGGQASASTGWSNNGATGGTSSFGTYGSATGGLGGAVAGGDSGNGTVNAPALTLLYGQGGTGSAGQSKPSGSDYASGAGGNSCLGGAGGGYVGGGVGNGGKTLSGGGGGGAGIAIGTGGNVGAGGGAGGCARGILLEVPSSVPVTVGDGGLGGVGGTNGFAGGKGGQGKVVVREYGYASGTAFTPQAAVSFGSKTWFGAGDFIAFQSTAPSTTRVVVSMPNWTNFVTRGAATNDASTNIQLTQTMNPGEYEVEINGLFRSATPPGTTPGTTCIWEIYDSTTGTVLSQNNVATPQTIASQSLVQDVTSLRAPLTIAPGTPSTRVIQLRVAKTVGSSTTGSLCEYFSSSTDPNPTIGYMTITPKGQYVLSPIVVGPFAQMPSGTITSSTYSVQPSDQIVEFDTTSNVITATLPTAVGNRGKTIRLVKVGGTANAVTILPQAGQTIAGASQTLLIEPKETAELYSDGAIWRWAGSSVRTVKFNFGGASYQANCTASPCTQAPGRSVSYAVINIPRNSAGYYSPAFLSGAFSTLNISCSGSGFVSGTGSRSLSVLDISTTAMNAYIHNAGTPVDGFADVICTGDR